MPLVSGFAAIINIERGALDPPARQPLAKSLPNRHVFVIRL